MNIKEYRSSLRRKIKLSCGLELTISKPSTKTFTLILSALPTANPEALRKGEVTFDYSKLAKILPQILVECVEEIDVKPSEDKLGVDEIAGPDAWEIFGHIMETVGKAAEEIQSFR